MFVSVDSAEKGRIASLSFSLSSQSSVIRTIDITCPRASSRTLFPKRKRERERERENTLARLASLYFSLHVSTVPRGSFVRGRRGSGESGIHLPWPGSCAGVIHLGFLNRPRSLASTSAVFVPRESPSSSTSFRNRISSSSRVQRFFSFYHPQRTFF